MSYPNWLEDFESHTIFTPAGHGFFRVLQMAKDAWNLAYNMGAEGSMTPGEFCTKYSDEPRNEIPYVAFDHPNDGAGV